MLKYDFSLKTRDGQRVRNIIISGVDRHDAERKLRQMYRQCEVLQCDVRGEVQQPGVSRPTTHDLFSSRRR